MIKRLISILLILLIAGLVLWLVRRARRRPGSGSAPETAVEPMVACAHCSLHIPHPEACWDRDIPYCGEAHRRAGPRPPG